MKYWRTFEQETQRLYSALLSDSSQQAAFRLTNRYHERLFFDLASRVLPAGNFLEIGAYEASTARRLADKCPQTWCMAFEADPMVFNKFRGQNVDGNELGNFAYVNKAVAARPGVMDFHKQVESASDIPAEFLPNNSLRRKSDTLTEVVPIECTSVDEILAERTGTSILRIDVEGTCFEVLQGAASSLSSVSVIYAEVEDYEIWMGQRTVFDVYGFLDAYNFIPVTRDVQTPGQYNVMFLRENLVDLRAVRGPLAIYHRRMSHLNRLSEEALELG